MVEDLEALRNELKLDTLLIAGQPGAACSPWRMPLPFPRKLIGYF
ncbi:MAG TPA: hypothetical protein VE621_02625 [Bryobacteraceae bacterium]|jgi:hypothetical protein|nr:hypothetical protein [Bryobacteraceae bacterium]